MGLRILSWWEMGFSFFLGCRLDLQFDRGGYSRRGFFSFKVVVVVCGGSGRSCIIIIIIISESLRGLLVGGFGLVGFQKRVVVV